jgi:hypothetical protein
MYLNDSYEMAVFDHKSVISRLLPKDKINVFDEFISEVEAYFHRQVSTISEMKERENKKAKGDVWELFCRDWLIASQRYVGVWLLKDFQAQFSSNLPKQDNGIDLIAQTPTGWVAIQCKYRSKAKTTDWKGLATFIGLCERTGPWEKFLVMTNCSGVTRKVPLTAKDQSICVGTFRGTNRETWLRLTGTFQEHRLSDVSTPNPKTLEELRAARLAKFEPILHKEESQQ